MTSVFTPEKDLQGGLLSAFASGAADRVALTELVLKIASALLGLFSILSEVSIFFMLATLSSSNSQIHLTCRAILSTRKAE